MRSIIKTKGMRSHRYVLFALILSFSVFRGWALDETVAIRPKVLESKEATVQRSVAGIVTDLNGNPLPGASILEKGTMNGVQTDFDGKFQITLESDEAILVVSYVGFLTQEISADDSTEITIVLQEDAQVLDEVVVTGYTGQSKRTITGAVEIIGGEELNKNPATSVEQQLQGKISGLNIVTNGAPGSASQVRIRGLATFGNKDPLYIIDGAPGGGLNDINPNDIQSVSVLKDGSAASIYGSRAANGVILITTKKGVKGQSMKISYDTFVSLDFDGGKKLDVLSPEQWGQMEWAGQRAGGNESPSHPTYGDGPNPVIPEYLNGDPTLPYDAETNRLLRSANTDWYDVLMRTGYSQNHNLSVRGGGQSGGYSLSFGYLDRQGTVIETSFQRYSTRVNSQFSFLKDRIRVGENLTVAYSESNGDVNAFDALNRRFSYFPLIPRYDEGGNFGGTLNGVLGLGTNFPNPEAAQIRRRDWLGQRWRIFGNAFIAADILPNLTFKSNLSIDFTQNASKNFNPEFPEGGNPGNSLTQTSAYSNLLTWTNTLDYRLEIGHHDIKLFGGVESIELTGRDMNFNGTKFYTTDPNFLNISNAGQVNSITGEGGLTRRLASIFGKMDYTFKDKYTFNFTLRRDGASSVGPNNRFDVFPAFGAGWIVSEEKFLEDSAVIDFLKLRLGWGQVGNVNTLSDFAFASIFRGDPSFSSTGYDIDGSNSNPPQNGITLTDRGNSDLKWETSETLNLGIDFGLFQNKLQGSVEWYDRKTKDLIQLIPVPLAAGIANPPFGNVGEIQNKGLDVTLSYNGRLGNEVDFELTGIISTYKNKVLDLNGNPDTFLSASYGNPPLITSRTEVGGEIGAFYGLIVDGVIQEGPNAGNFDFRDLNDDGNIDPLDDATVIGSPHPDFTYSLNFVSRYRNFDLSMFFRGSQGNDIFEYSRIFSDFQIRDLNRSTRVLNAWTPDNPSNVLAQYNGLTAGDNSRSSSYYVQDGSYLRLQTLQLGYTFPELPGIDKLRLYLQGQNVFTLTGYSGNDPEIGENTGLQIGVDGNGAYAPPRSFLLGLNITL